MFTERDSNLIVLCLEGFLYGKIFVQCALNFALSKEVQLFSGIYRDLFRNIRYVFTMLIERFQDGKHSSCFLFSLRSLRSIYGYRSQ